MGFCDQQSMLKESNKTRDSQWDQKAVRVRAWLGTEEKTTTVHATQRKSWREQKRTEVETAITFLV
jgi:hypothetical protein